MQISDIDTRSPNPTVREGLGSQFSVLLGLAILGVTGVAFASLASWSVLDPSLSHANTNEVTNIMGFPGAVFADVSMQFFGLASAFALIPPAIWGWQKLLQREIQSARFKLLLWPVSMVLSASFFACLPVVESWPLPLGLGGVVGDYALAIPSFMTGEVTGLVAALMGICMAVISVVSVVWSAGLFGFGRSDTSVESLANDLEEQDEDDPSVLLGIIGHYYYSFRMKFSARRHRAENDGSAQPSGQVSA